MAATKQDAAAQTVAMQFENQPVVKELSAICTWKELVKALEEGAGLPRLNSRGFDAGFPLDTLVEKFAYSVLTVTLNNIAARIRQIAYTSGSPFQERAKTLDSLLNGISLSSASVCLSSLPYWARFESFLEDEQRRPLSSRSFKFTRFLREGRHLEKKLVHRVCWLLAIQYYSPPIR